MSFSLFLQFWKRKYTAVFYYGSILECFDNNGLHFMTLVYLRVTAITQVLTDNLTGIVHQLQMPQVIFKTAVATIQKFYISPVFKINLDEVTCITFLTFSYFLCVYNNVSFLSLFQVSPSCILDSDIDYESYNYNLNSLVSSFFNISIAFSFSYIIFAFHGGIQLHSWIFLTYLWTKFIVTHLVLIARVSHGACCCQMPGKPPW